MGYIIENKSKIPNQKPLSDEIKYKAKITACFGQRFKFQSTTEIQPCLKIGVLLTEEFVKDDAGNLMRDKENNLMPRYAHIGTFNLSFSERSQLPKFFVKLFPNEILDAKAWNGKYQGGDLLLALIHNAPCSVFLSEPVKKINPKTGEEVIFQCVGKIKDFVPNANPDVKNNPPERDINNQVVTGVSNPTIGNDDNNDDVPF